MPHALSRWGLKMVREAGLWLSDVTTGNVSTANHGFAPKLPNDATKYLDGTGAYSIPAGSAGFSATVTSPQLDDVIKYSGSAWVNGAVPTPYINYPDALNDPIN